MYPVEFVVRRSGTHRTHAPDFPDSAACRTALFLRVNVRSTSHSGLCLSKYPSENTRQVSVFDIRITPGSLAQFVHFILVRVFNFAASQLKIEFDFSNLATKAQAPPKASKAPYAVQLPRIIELLRAEVRETPDKHSTRPVHFPIAGR